MLTGEIEVDWSLQGTLIERIRAAATASAAFSPPTGLGTAAGEGRPRIELDGRDSGAIGAEGGFCNLATPQADYWAISPTR